MIPRKPELRQLLAAEYVLGNLRGPMRRRFERLRDDDAAFCDEADAWEAKLSGLVDLLPGVEPPPQVWDKVRQELGQRPADGSLLRRVWASAGFWRLLALAAAALATGLLVFMP